MATELAERRETGMTTAAEPTTLLHVLERAASDPNVDVDKMERLMGMYERQSAKIAEQEFNKAMSAAQSEIGRVSADANNAQTRSRYATYAKLDRVLRPVYTTHGFALSFGTAEAPQPDYVRVVCHVSHDAGHSRSYQVDMPADGKGAKGGDVMTKTHAVGSATQYGMRYLLKMIFNVAIGEDDDDGDAASLTPISGQQHDTLLAKIEATGTNIERFCKAFGIEELRQLPASRFDSAVKALNQKAKQNGA